MKILHSFTFILSCVVLLFASPVLAQKEKACDMSCCGPQSATEKFAAFASSKEFRKKHLEPRPFVLANPLGKMVTIPVEGGKAANAYEIKAEKPSNLYLLVFHEWWGLNDYVKQESDRLYNELGKKVNVWAIDLYDGNVATTREDAQKYMGGLDQNRAHAIMAAAVKAGGPTAKFGTIGWCMGGGMSMQASLAAGKQGAGCVIYYGMPELDEAKLANLNAPVLNIWPKQDKWINQEVQDKFNAAMKKAGKELRTEAYDADHAFANPSNPKHDSKATTDANNKSVAFLKQHLK